MKEIQLTQVERLWQLHGEIMGVARMVLDKAIEARGKHACSGCRREVKGSHLPGRDI